MPDPGAARGSSRRELALLGIAIAVAIGSIAAVIMIARGAPKVATTTASRPKPGSSVSPSAIPADAGTRTLLVEVSTPPNLVGPQTVHWMRLDGTEAATRPLPVDQAVLGAGGAHVLVYRADGHVLDLHQDGSETDVGQGMPATTARGATSLPVHSLVSPDGTQWIWGQVVSQPGNMVTSTLTLAGVGVAPHVIAEATEEGRALEPYRWALADPLVAHAALGAGGYILFDQAFGQVDQLHLTSGTQTPIGPAQPDAVDVAGDSARAYVGINPGTTTKLLTVAGPGERGLSATLPPGGEAGGMMFDGSSHHLVFCTSPASSPGHEHFETDVLDIKSGARSRFGPPDLRPATWLPDGRLVEFRTTSDGDGVPGTYLVSLGGTAVKISSYSTVAGVLEASPAP